MTKILILFLFLLVLGETLDINNSSLALVNKTPQQNMSTKTKHV